jgi:hypothetical protein
MKSMVLRTPPSRSNQEGSEVTYGCVRHRRWGRVGEHTAAALYLVRTILEDAMVNARMDRELFVLTGLLKAKIEA